MPTMTNHRVWPIMDQQTPLYATIIREIGSKHPNCVPAQDGRFELVASYSSDPDAATRNNKGRQAWVVAYRSPWEPGGLRYFAAMRSWSRWEGERDEWTIESDGGAGDIHPIEQLKRIAAAHCD